MLAGLTFIGGTCLRSCYGGIRLSEDLDFTGGNDFTRDRLAQMGALLTESIHQKYGLTVCVSEPIKDKQNVNTWKIKVETRPQQKQVPAQRINIDICAIPSYEKQPMMLLNPYGISTGTGGLIVQSQSREEIYVDTLLAFAFRPNRIKYRDVWDIIWLHGLGIQPRLELIPLKLRDRNYSIDFFLSAFENRVTLLTESHEMEAEFKHEMLRFLSKENKFFEQENMMTFVCTLLKDLYAEIIKKIS